MADGNSIPLDTISTAAPRRSMWRRWRRPLLLIAVPGAVLLGAGYVYVTGGRYVETDNAYVKAHMVSVSTDISGRVTAVNVRENELVPAGTRLLQLDEEPLRIALSQAEAKRESERNDILAMKAAYRQRGEDLAAAQSTLGMAGREYDRRAKLLSGRIISESEFDTTRNARDVAQQQVASVQQDMQRLLAGLGGDPEIRPEDHPRYRAAQSVVDAAERDLRLATVTAPAAGIVAQVDTIRPGDYARAGQPVLSLVSPDDVWIEANYKETDLTYMRPGQKAEISVDTYPGETFDAVVDSIGAATGAEFSLLPPQNATGNWVKVVQRIPVRLKLIDRRDDMPLRAGMSAVVDVDTEHHREIPSFIRSAALGGRGVTPWSTSWFVAATPSP